MRAIDKKLLRDFRRLWLQALAIALVLACGVAIMLTAVGMFTALSDTRSAYYERYRFADVFANAKRAPAPLMTEISAIDGALSAEARVGGYVILDIPGRVKSAVGRILSYPDVGTPVLNVPLIVSGRAPDPTSQDEVMVNAPFAEANAFDIGDTFSANLNGQKRDLRIVGTALSPEFVYTIGPGQLMPDNSGYGILWMSERATAAAFDLEGAFNFVSLSLLPGAQSEPVIDHLDHLLGPYGGLGAIDRSQHESNAFLDAEIEQLQGMATVLPPIFFAISGFLVSMVMGRIITLERSEIGLLKAIGYSNTEICVHYLLLSALIAVAGILLGWAAGTVLARLMALQYAQFFNFPFVVFSVSYWVYGVTALAALLTTVLGALQAALRAARLAPAVSMQPPAPPRFKRSWVDRMMTAMRLSQPTIMILRSFARWPVRSLLTSLGMGLAVAAVIASVFIEDALEVIVDMAFYQSNRQHAVLLFSEDVPISTLEDARRLPGVLQAESQQFHPAILSSGHLSKRISIEARPPDTDLSRALDSNGQPIAIPPGGIVLSHRLADQLGVQIGDLLEAEFLSGRRETFDLTVVNRVEQHFGLGAYMDLDFINAMFRQSPQLSTINVTLDPARTDDLHRMLKDTPRLTGLVEMQDNRRSFQDTIDQNISVMNGVYIVIAVLITLGVTYNAARIQLSERARELASLRILGFTRGEVSYVLVGEMMLLAILAQPIGWLIGAWIAAAMTRSFTSDLYSMPLILMPATFALASLVVLGAAFASVMIVRQKLDRLNLVSVMKTRE